MNARSPAEATVQPVDLPASRAGSADLSRITLVSDTAFWTAGIRAREQRRPDALYEDPYADRLAGEKGRLITDRLGCAKEIEWGVSMRTVSIDRLILDACAEGLDAVVNLGAGLDSRPYRLPLPQNLTWIEADKPELVEYKDARLAGIQPRCVVQRVGADLALSSGRQRVLSHIAYGFSKTLVLAEGLIPYLSAQEVTGLARDLIEERAVHQWIVDYDGGGPQWAPAYRKQLEAVPRRFQMPHLIALLKFCSWEAVKQIGTGEQAAEFGRPYPVVFPRSFLWRILPGQWKAHIENLSGVALLQRA